MVPHAILVVDDDRLVRESLCEMLCDLSQQAVPTDNGSHAMERLAQSCFDLVLSDVDMPDFSGFELLDRTLRLDPHPSVVLMSARAEEQLERAAIEAGAIALLCKPVGMHQLTRMIDQLWPDHPIVSEHSSSPREGQQHG